MVREIERSSSEARELSVANLLTRWLGQIEPTASAYYLREARRRVNQRLIPAFGKVHIEDLRPPAIDAQYRKWLAEGLSPNTVRGFHAILNAAFHQAERWEWIDRNPVGLVKPPSVAHQKPKAPSMAELRTILEAVEPESALFTAIALAAVTGARRGELCALRWSDVDLDNATLNVAKSLTAINADWTIGDTKTHQERLLALDPLSIGALRRRRLRQEEYAIEVGVRLAPDAFVLSRDPEGDLPCLPDGLSHAFGKLCKHLGLSFHFHQMRHFAATMAIGSGHDIRAVANRLGHADPSVTLRIYTAALTERDQEIAATLGGALGPG